MTFHLTPDVGRQIEIDAAQRGVKISRVVDEILATHYSLRSNYLDVEAAE